MSELMPGQSASGESAPRRRDARLMDCGGDGGGHIRSRTEIERTRRALTRAQLKHDEALAVIAPTDELMRASSRIVEESIALRAELRANIISYVRELRHGGLPPEQMLVQIKSALREILPYDLDAVASRELVSDVVRWSIDAYYADLPPGAATS